MNGIFNRYSVGGLFLGFILAVGMVGLASHVNQIWFHMVDSQVVLAVDLQSPDAEPDPGGQAQETTDQDRPLEFLGLARSKAGLKAASGPQGIRRVEGIRQQSGAGNRGVKKPKPGESKIILKQPDAAGFGEVY